MSTAAAGSTTAKAAAVSTTATEAVVSTMEAVSAGGYRHNLPFFITFVFFCSLSRLGLLYLRTKQWAYGSSPIFCFSNIKVHFCLS